MQYKSQTEAVLAHLKNKGNITSIQAIQLYGASRLSAIIFVLRRRGYKIMTVPFKVKNRFGTTSLPAKYILLENDDE